MNFAKIKSQPILWIENLETPEAFTQRYSCKKVFKNYATKLQENTHDEAFPEQCSFKIAALRSSPAEVLHLYWIHILFLV